MSATLNLQLTKSQAVRVRRALRVRRAALVRKEAGFAAIDDLDAVLAVLDIWVPASG